IAPTPSVLPADAAGRAVVMDLSRDIFGEGGLAWSRRLQMIHAGLNNAGGFPGRVAGYLAKKYGYSPEVGAASGARVAEVLGKLAARLKEQKKAGSHYYVANSVTALDVYAATALAMFRAP